MEFVAFDYDRQAWVTGREAIPLMIKQDTEELESLRDPGYVKWMQMTPEEVTRRMNELQRELQTLAAV